MKRRVLLLVAAVLMSLSSISQSILVKNYQNHKAGEASLLYSEATLNSGYAARSYVFDLKGSLYYDVRFLICSRAGSKFYIYLDKVKIATVICEINGWQELTIPSVYITKGKHSMEFQGLDVLAPMVEEISMIRSGTNMPVSGTSNWSSFLNDMRALEQKPVVSFKSAAEVGDQTNTPAPQMVLPNPAGNYDHDINTTFAYTNFSWVYLSAGYHVFTTGQSTVLRTLSVFNPANITYTSSANVNSGANGESWVSASTPTGAWYVVMLRPFYNGQTGTSNIYLDGNLLVSNATVGGRYFQMASLKGGVKNFFTCRLTGGDTRMVAMRYPASSARGYNDDYYGGGGDWNWGYASRIKKDFSGYDSVQYGFVCAYSPSSNGTCDTYMGNENSDVYNTNYPEFPLLKADDAIKAAPNTGTYNCISWSGGITTTWIWPPSQYSTYNCSGSYSDIACFDNFYGNIPSRYPGAYTYVRTGATVNNSIVDLWALNGGFTHGSVRKPSNNHPHGYDWESKPGSTSRTFHPRYALTNNVYGYGSVVNYYIHNGTYGNMVAGQSFSSEIDAVNAGLAVIENAILTSGASDKLKALMGRVDRGFSAAFEENYQAWKKTWKQNEVYSDPAMYCKNEAHKLMEELSQKNPSQALILVMNKFVNEKDHLIGELMWSLTREKYGKLLAEVKAERSRNPNNDKGLYRVHGDHDNGVLYVEKILASLNDKPVIEIKEEILSVTISPNPIQNDFRVRVQLTKVANVEVKVINAQTGISSILQAPRQMQPGIYNLKGFAQQLSANTGDILTIYVIVNGEAKVYKAIVSK